MVGEGNAYILEKPKEVVIFSKLVKAELGGGGA